jgi:hypothetical protein
VDVKGKTVSVPGVGSDVYEKIFQRTLPYLSHTLLNVDWNKVGDFCKYLHVLETDVDQSSVWTNDLSWASPRWTPSPPAAS